MAKKIALIVLTFVMVAAVIFTGCTPARKPYNTGNQNNQTGMNGTANNQNDPPLTNNWGTRDTAYNNNLGSNIDTGNNNGAGTNVNYNATQRTNQLERTIEQMQGVRDATVVISGNTAYVGLELDTNTANNINYENTANNTETRNTNTAGNNMGTNTETNTGTNMGSNTGTNGTNNTAIKNNVAQKVRASNTNIDTVYVSTETDFTNRLRNVGNGVNGGRPISGFRTELRDMVRRINPMNW